MEDRIVPSITAIISILILLMSLVFGVLFYYFVSQENKAMKKKLIEDVVSLTVNFVIYMWVGKVMIHFAKFVKDPIAILAFPSNAKAFYVATFLIIMNLLYRKIRHEQSLFTIVRAFIPVFLAASFMFEFFQIILKSKSSNWPYLAFVFFLLIAYVITNGKVNIKKQLILISYSWIVGQFFIVQFLNTTMFNYRISAIYYIVLLLFIIVIHVFNMKKKV